MRSQPADQTLALPLRALRVVAIVVALGLLAVILAYWFWQFYEITQTRAVPPAIEVESDAATLASASRWLGGDAQPALSKEAANVALVLKGAIAFGGGRGTAILAGSDMVAGKLRDRTANLGDTLGPGTKLAGVYATWIEVETATGKERIDLDWKSRGQQLARAGVSAGNLPSVGSTGVTGLNLTLPNLTTPFALDVTKSGNEVAFSRRQLDNALKDASMLNRLGQVGPAPAGGARVASAPPGSLLDRIGLQPGDVITNINGTRINTPGDLAGLYQQFGTTNKISAEVNRQGATIRLNYTISP
jgi:general secretion pathway protein C